MVFKRQTHILKYKSFTDVAKMTVLFTEPFGRVNVDGTDVQEIAVWRRVHAER